MYQSDIRILDLIERLKSLGLIRFDNDFCDSIGLHKQNLVSIRKGVAHFTPRHIENICKVFKINANWIFGIENQLFIKISSVQKSAQYLK